MQDIFPAIPRIKIQALQQLHLNGLELTRNCKNFLSWAGELFIIPHVHKTSKDATPPLQGKRKRVQVHECKSRRRASLEEISNATDEGTNGKTDTSEASRIVLVARIATKFSEVNC